MTKLFTKTIGGLVAVAALVAAASPADARHRNRHRGHSGTAITAGIIGLGLGAAIASSNRGYYRGGYYDPYYGGYDPYYGRGYYDGYGDRGYYGYRPHRRCVTRRTWDPYYRRYVRVRYC